MTENSFGVPKPVIAITLFSKVDLENMSGIW